MRISDTIESVIESVEPTIDQMIDEDIQFESAVEAAAAVDVLDPVDVAHDDEINEIVNTAIGAGLVSDKDIDDVADGKIQVDDNVEEDIKKADKEVEEYADDAVRDGILAKEEVEAILTGTPVFEALQVDFSNDVEVSDEASESDNEKGVSLEMANDRLTFDTGISYLEDADFNDIFNEEDLSKKAPEDKDGDSTINKKDTNGKDLTPKGEDFMLEDDDNEYDMEADDDDAPTFSAERKAYHDDDDDDMDDDDQVELDSDDDDDEDHKACPECGHFPCECTTSLEEFDFAAEAAAFNEGLFDFNHIKTLGKDAGAVEKTKRYLALHIASYKWGIPYNFLTGLFGIGMPAAYGAEVVKERILNTKGKYRKELLTNYKAILKFLGSSEKRSVDQLEKELDKMKGKNGTGSKELHWNGLASESLDFAAEAAAICNEADLGKVAIENKEDGAGINADDVEFGYEGYEVGADEKPFTSTFKSQDTVPDSVFGKDFWDGDEDPSIDEMVK